MIYSFIANCKRDPASQHVPRAVQSAVLKRGRVCSMQVQEFIPDVILMGRILVNPMFISLLRSQPRRSQSSHNSVPSCMLLKGTVKKTFGQEDLIPKPSTLNRNLDHDEVSPYMDTSQFISVQDSSQAAGSSHHV